MRRAIALGITLSVLAAACALLEPGPPGTRPIQITVHNDTRDPVDVVVTTPAGAPVSQGFPSVGPGGLTGTLITVNVPVDGGWVLELGTQAQVRDTDYAEYTSQGCMFGIRLDRGGSYSYGCDNEL